MTAILAALRELELGEVDIPVKDLDDATMIKIMANENMEDWETNTSVINETIQTVHDFLVLRDQKSHIGAEAVKWCRQIVELIADGKIHGYLGTV